MDGRDVMVKHLHDLLKEVVHRDLTLDEVVSLTLTLACSGVMLDWREEPEMQGKVSVDLPSTGGVGNKTPLLAPVLALAAAPDRLFVPKLSSRGRTAGTIDILESIGYRADLCTEEYQGIVRRIGISNMEQTKELAPADRLCMDLRREMGLMEQAQLVVSSVLAKKLAVGCRNIVIDVKAGPTSKFGNLLKTVAGARLFVEVGRELKRMRYLDQIRAVVSSNYELQGLAHGRRVALKEVMEVLQGKGAADIHNLSADLAARMLLMAGVVASLQEARGLIHQTFHGSAFEKFRELLQAHRADWAKLEDMAPYRIPVRAQKNGQIWKSDVALIDRCCQELQRAEGAMYTAGIVFEGRARGGDRISEGDLLATVHSEDEKLGEEIAGQLQKAFPLYEGRGRVVPRPGIIAECWLEGEEIRQVVWWQRVSRSSLGIITKTHNGRKEFLLRYNRKWDGWNFLSGHFEPGKDQNFQDTMVREFIEEVGPEIGERPPALGKDFSVRPLEEKPLVELAFSESTGQWTLYELHLFGVLLEQTGTQWPELWKRHPELFRWFSLDELQRGISGDGLASPTPFPLGCVLERL